MKKIVIFIVILFVIGGIIWFLTSLGKPSPSLEAPIVPTEESVIHTESTEVMPTIDPIAKLKNELTIPARVFIERYGTWSNQSNFENFEDLLPYMTEKLKTETETQISKYRNIEKSSYYGLTTNVVSLSLKNFIPDEQAEFSALVQQQETKNGVTQILYKTAELIFIKEGIGWRVDDIDFK